MIRGSTKFGPEGGCNPGLLQIPGLPGKRRESLAIYANQGLSQKTWSSYKTAERMWKKCESETKEKLELPWGQSQTLFFLDWLLTDRGVSSATACSYLAGIKKLHEVRGLDEPVLRKNLVNQILKGKRNMEATKKRSSSDMGRLPVTLTVMKMIKEQLRQSASSRGKKLLVWAVATLAFHGSFRIHEILCKNETFYDPDFCLLGRDIKTGVHKWEDGTVGQVLNVTVKCPKENKVGGTVIVDVYETGGPTCPLKAFQKWEKDTTRESDKVLFRDEQGTPFTGRKFNDTVKSLLEPHIDYRKGKVTAHSFRSGIPTLLGSMGHSEEEIKKIGRWSSRAFEYYLKLPRTSRAQIAGKLGKI